MVTSLFKDLGLLDCVVFQHLAANEFEVIYNPNSWILPVIPQAIEGRSISISDNCPFLLDFLEDAKPHWLSGNAQALESGIWTESINQQPLRLEAQAMMANSQSYLVVHRLKESFEKKQQTLQLARELLISNDHITAQHEQLHHKMAELLKLSDTQNTLEQPIIQALEQAEIGMAILDTSMQMLKSNHALQTLLIDSPIEINQPVDRLILDLFKKQYPEYERICATRQPWTGELCWLNPPEQGKWLKVSLHPVLDEQNLLQYWVLSVSDVTQIKFLLKRNEKLTHYDALTDLPNRQYFWQHLEDKALKGRPFYLIYLDIARFKRVNELYGHTVGDELIVSLAKRLHSVTRVDDVIARIGGTEFAIIMSVDDFNPQDHHNLEGQCRSFINEIISSCRPPFYLESGNKCELGLNIGATVYPKDSEKVEELMKFADIAVSAAKKMQSSNMAFYSQKLVDDAIQRLQMENDLQNAIRNNEFELFFQPIIDLQSGQMIKAEALIRWRKACQTLVSPADFIPLAEQTGLIVPIGKWVINQACIHMKALAQSPNNTKISVNLSPRQIADRQLFSYIKDSLVKHQIEPTALEIELTEGVLIDDYDKVQHLISDLRALGVTIAIDDFGTGYSSLAYLQKLAIDNIKIDRSFITTLSDNAELPKSDSAIVLAVIAMAKSLQVGVIAEGVETASQKAFLAKHQCPNAQGFLFSKPLPFEQFLALPKKLD